MKKLFILLLSLTILVGIISGMAIMANSGAAQSESKIAISVDTIQIGDYFTLGKYNDEPIIWRYVADDENGKLIASNETLCAKVFGASNFWEKSFIRQWLNSDVSEGEVEWDFGDIPDYVNVELNPREKGFMHESNFTQSERNVLKTVTQWTMLPEDHLDLATNGIEQPYSAIKEFRYGSPKDGGGTYYYESSDFPEVYFGAAHKVTDTVFLLDEMQVYHMWENVGRYNFGTPNAGTALYLRTPSEDKVTAIQSSNYVAWASANYPCDIRPAFYLNTDNAVILSGSGTEADPYIMTGKDGECSTQEPKGGISVFCDGTELDFDQPPIMDNDRVLVPMRAIFESLGATVGWDGDTQTVTAVRDDVKIVLQIDSNMMYKNDEEIELDVPAKLLNSRTLVPIRAVSEALGAEVEWIGETETVMIRT